MLLDGASETLELVTASASDAAEARAGGNGTAGCIVIEEYA